MSVLKDELFQTDTVTAAAYDTNSEQPDGQTGPILSIKTELGVSPLDVLAEIVHGVQRTTGDFINTHRASIDAQSAGSLSFLLAASGAPLSSRLQLLTAVTRSFVVLLTGLDADFELAFHRNQRTLVVQRVGVKRVVYAVEVDHPAPAVGPAHGLEVEVATRFVRLLGVRPVVERNS